MGLREGMDFQLLLVDTNPLVCEQFEIQFSEFDNIEVHSGYFQDVESYDCMVSPANSFGKMDGGIDAAIIEYFGKQLEENVQKYILENYFGEQPVGTSFIIETSHKKHPFLAHTPTMRMPEDIRGKTNVYYAMKAMLVSVFHHNVTQEKKINTILCPGMGTFIGKMPPEKAVEQMALAYKHFIEPPSSINVPFIYERVSEIEMTK